MEAAIINKLTRDFSVEIPPLCQKFGTEFGLASISIINLDSTFLHLSYALFICIGVAVSETLSSRLLLRRMAR
jgi:hypothetical protein